MPLAFNIRFEWKKEQLATVLFDIRVRVSEWNWLMLLEDDFQSLCMKKLRASYMTKRITKNHTISLTLPE